ncbi:MAG: hypothetical protein U0941_07145 [Planctomycetaceae bacterium]
MMGCFAGVFRLFRCQMALILLLSTAASGLVRAEDDFTEPDAEDFAYPVAWLKSGPVKDRMYFANSRNKLLKLGWEGQPAVAISTARTEYEAARKRCPDDPRLDYAFGLVLWRNGRSLEAIKQFDLAARLNVSKPPFLPAAQAAAWSRLLEGQREPGLKQIVQVARVLNKAKGDYPTPVQKNDSALFLGRAVEFLLGPGITPATAEDDKQQLDEVVKLIPTQLKTQFQSGRNQISDRYDELKALAVRPAAEVEAEYRTKQEETEKLLADCRMEGKRLGDEIDMSARTQKVWLKEINQKIGQLEWKLAQCQLGLRTAVTAADYFSRPQKHYETRTREVKEKDEKGKGYQYKTEKYQVEREETSFERQQRLTMLANARAEASALLEQRNTASTELSSLNLERRSKGVEFQDLQKKRRTDRARQFGAQRELTLKLKQIQSDYVSPAELKSRVNTIAPYVPWDVDTERDGLLASYKITLPETTSP